jgi:hypothetical protein
LIADKKVNILQINHNRLGEKIGLCKTIGFEKLGAKVSTGR